LKEIHWLARLIFTGLFLINGCRSHEPEMREVQGPNSSQALQSAPTVALCELMREPGIYDKKVVRTSGVFLRNIENAVLSDDRCSSKDLYVWVEIDPAYSASTEPIKEKLEQLLCPTQPCPLGKAKIVAVGRFDGPNGGPYGHLDGYRYRFSLMQLEQAEPITSP
jgi:hypothetical protein